MLKPTGLELNLNQRELVPTATGKYSIQEFLRNTFDKKIILMLSFIFYLAGHNVSTLPRITSGLHSFNGKY